MAIELKALQSLLEETFANAEITIDDLAGDNNHYSVTVKSKEFQGTTRIQQHKMVYDALKGAMASDLHALAIRTESL
jgi:stress-induced morphogen